MTTRALIRRLRKRETCASSALDWDLIVEIVNLIEKRTALHNPTCAANKRFQQNELASPKDLQFTPNGDLPALPGRMLGHRSEIAGGGSPPGRRRAARMRARSSSMSNGLAR